ncbi:MAG: peptidase S8 [Candidatus Eremiobacteraeota bacterium]|nr:peptidase S8 [Candidatus Eremiobacteraeota bacterium]
MRDSFTSFPAIAASHTRPAAIPGLHPDDLRSAYRFARAGGAGQIVAVIAAGDDPTAEADLAVYRAAFGLQACGAADGCFHKVNQFGGKATIVKPLAGWAQEIGLDVEMISAVCPACRILVVEAQSADLSDLAASVDTAVALGASAVSNSYYAPEYDSELEDEVHFNHPGVAITASSGDLGFGPTFPASSRYVIAVGGTTLLRTGTHMWHERVWSATGSGCSKYIEKPHWQHDKGCPKRTVTDLAVVADPQTGVAGYNTTAPAVERGWAIYGGTSVGAPIVAALSALSRHEHRVARRGASHVYAHPASFNAVVSWNNGSCDVAYLCNGGFGYNGPAGVGTPNGTTGL